MSPPRPPPDSRRIKTALRKASTLWLVFAFALAPLPPRASADDSIARIKKITSPSKDPQRAKEVSYPTTLVQLVKLDDDQQNVDKDTAIQPGEAVLTRSANTHVRMDKGLEALLYSDTFVRFDGLNVWLLRHGSAYVVSKRGRLEIVAEALGRILVNSRVYVRTDGSELLVYVTEGHVVLEANARTLSLRPGQAGRILLGEGPQEASLAPEEEAQIRREIETAERVMKGGGGGGWVAGLLAAAAVGAVIATSGHGGDGGTGGGGGKGGGTLPDLVPDGGQGGCRFDDNGNLLVGVRNQGQGDAPASTTRIAFEGAESRTALAYAGPRAQDLETPSIRAGDSASVALGPRAPRGLRLKVTADSSDRVGESNEGNNTALVTCPVD